MNIQDTKIRTSQDCRGWMGPTSSLKKAVFKELTFQCICNGLSYENIDEEGPQTTALEMFFSGYPRIVGMRYFPNLTTLTLVGQCIKNITGLNHCLLLRELWIAECCLVRISGLHKCVHLERLYLYCNEISKIENLEALTKLHVLWLNNNQIKTIEGLHTLQNLQEVNFAGNLITKIGSCFDFNTKIEKINLSDNNLSSFKELTNLSRLPNLKDLALNDPLYGPNPVCLLSNYAVHVLYHIPQLQRLDTDDVSQKQTKSLAETTVMKKITYYRMRVKSVQRQLHDKLEELKDKKSRLQSLPESKMKLFSCNIKQLEHELDKMEMLDKKTNSESRRRRNPATENSAHDNEDAEKASLKKAFVRKINAMKERITFWNRKLDEIEKEYQMEMKKKKKSFNLLLQFLFLELETVGNIHLEEGFPHNPWFSSCCNLIQSRFCSRDFRAYDIIGVKINRAFRVHNEVLRLKFEEKLQTFLEEENFSVAENYKEKMEYLFYVFNPELSVKEKQLLQILEDGFHDVEMHVQPERSEAVLLCNSLSICECPRIEFLTEQAKAEGENRSDPEESFRRGTVIIAKVFLGHSVPFCPMYPICQVNYPEANSVFRPWKCLERDSSPSEDEMWASLEQRNRDSNGWQCEWFVFDHDLVLPEYIAEVEYITLVKDKSLFSTCNVIMEGRKRSTELVLSDDLQRDDEVLKMEPTVEVRPKITCLDEENILAVAMANICSQLRVLNLHGNRLNKLQNISKVKTLQKLIISFNDFTSLNDIYDLPNLEYFDASHNYVITLEGIGGLSKLQFFDLSWNQLKKSKEVINILCKHTPNLQSLDIRHNPWYKPTSIRLSVIGQLKNLTNLDGVLITDEEATEASHYIAGSKITQASLLEYSRIDEEKPAVLSVFSCATILSQISKNRVDLQMHHNWYSMITVLNLDDQHLCKISNLEQLEHLRWASFSNNNLTQVEGLESCLNLEELTLDDNCISTLDGISKLTKLTRLSVNNNHLTSLKRHVFENLPHLHYISVENNRIASLVGLKKTYALIELYISNNCISMSQEIYHLKGLTKLIILDMSGNRIVWKQDNYRLFVLFHLPFLQALDGISVEPPEGECAKDLFGGKLTSDMIADRLGQSDFTEMQELNWANSNIRAVELVPADQFRNVHSVNLQNNNLTSFSGLIFLPNVKVLCLNYNHIESILPRQKTANELTNRQQLHRKVISSGYGQQEYTKGGRDAEEENLPPIMQSLEVLHLGHNGITDMAYLQLSRLKNLKFLFLQGNFISQIEGLEGLQFLQELVLDHNRIKRIPQGSLAGLSALQTLHLEKNQIRELNGLKPLAKLQKLFLQFNRIREVSELEKLQAIPNLRVLSLHGNPVHLKKNYRSLLFIQMPALQVLDGTSVNTEEKDFRVANSTKNSGFPTLPDSSTTRTPFRVSTVDLNESINRLFDTFGHKVEEPLLSKSNKSTPTNPLIATHNFRSSHGERAFRQAKGATTHLRSASVPRGVTSQTSQLHKNNRDNAGR
ncbi:leucine-rich repeat-containing protein 9 isoform X3 [Coturnix japonica]|uniref:leucine-rich repeat-containing protein 9 isoform X3 n=1 Tax=Coturnix japonica TaxID=93934 RepID=UPI0007777C46|nr:leucine-rich repeat-containing protein 9 isoform X3 [Coturnix japonica]